MRAFTLALESLGKPPFSIGKIAPTPKLVDQYFNEFRRRKAKMVKSMRAGPSNEGEPWEYFKSPAFQDLQNCSGPPGNSR